MGGQRGGDAYLPMRGPCIRPLGHDAEEGDEEGEGLPGWAEAGVRPPDEHRGQGAGGGGCGKVVTRTDGAARADVLWGQCVARGNC